MVLDTLSIPAMSMECERVFFQCEEAAYPNPGQPAGGHHQGYRVLESLVGWRDHTAAREGASEIYSKQFSFGQSRYL
jgi:hypothetical protein